MIKSLDQIYPVVDRHRRVVAMAAYGGVAAIAYLFAFLLRFEFHWQREYAVLFAASLPVLVLIRLTWNLWFKLNAERWRFISTRTVLRLVGATTAGTITFYLAVRLLPFTPAVPSSVILLEWMLSIFLTAGMWIAYRTAFEQRRHRRSGNNGCAKRVLIVGAGEAGNLLAHEMCRFPTGYRPVGFVDDNPAKWGTSVQGVEVIGSTEQLPAIAVVERAQEIIIAVPSAAPTELGRIVALCEASGLPFKALPGITEVLAGDVLLNHLREVTIDDLLGREPIQLELPELAQDLRSRCILITGAAGSIGSELARQVARYEPGKLILFDQAETELYYLTLELRERHEGLNTIPVVGDVVDEGAVERVFEDHAPERVFHAAAYKHVMMMEGNAREALKNNVLGTWRVAEVAGRHRTDTFVLLSTDKAVRPASVMGASKRLAEMLLLELQDRYSQTTYTAVRFGNVLGSKGSVIPIFQRQLEAGKPLTVTHPDATRFFMTIPEAVQLILQASLLPDVRGHIAMLEMGEAVRIMDLAQNILRLSGAERTNGRRVVITGLGPGEKLHEELVSPDEVTRLTAIPKVRIIEGNGADAPAVLETIEDCDWDVDRTVEALVARLHEIFPQLEGSERPVVIALD